MRISDRYIGKQVLFGTLYAVLVLGVVLVLGNLYKQVQPLLVDQKAPLELVVRFVISVLPLSLMYTIPWGFLSAVLVVFGRMSSNQEITGFRVGGVSLVRLSAPVFVIGALLSVVSLWLNMNVVPYSKASAKQLALICTQHPMARRKAKRSLTWCDRHAPPIRRDRLPSWSARAVTCAKSFRHCAVRASRGKPSTSIRLPPSNQSSTASR